MENKQLINTIYFNVKTDNPAHHSGIIPWISIAYFEEDLDGLVDADEIVIAASEINIKIDYPLTNPVYFDLKNENGFTRSLLIKEISTKYLTIFEEEDLTYQVETNMGKHGIWGHEVGELDLAAIDVYKNEDGQTELVLRVDS